MAVSHIPEVGLLHVKKGNMRSRGAVALSLEMSKYTGSNVKAFTLHRGDPTGYSCCQVPVNLLL